MRGKPLSQEERLSILHSHRRRESAAVIARGLGRSKRTVQRVLSQIRTADEFSKALTLTKPPKSRGGPVTWSLEAIRNARDDQQKGDFKQPVRLAEALKTDTALYTAYHNRIDTQSAVEAILEPSKGVEGERVLKKAMRSVFTPRSVLKGIHGTLADHGIAIGYVKREANADGTLVNFELTEWPLEHVRFNENSDTLETRTLEGVVVPIVHGDGEWIVFRKFEHKPWTEEAALLPAALLWPMHTGGLQSWAGAMNSHGLAKVVGQLPAGIALMSEDGSLTPEAEAFLDMITDIASGDAAAGIVPPGGDAKFITNTSSAWQVFSEMINGREKAAARIYLGTDATLGSVGGAPGVDISALFGVATTKLQGDFAAIEQGINTGLVEPWAAVNFGESRHAPKLKYQLPDPDAEKKSEEEANRLERLTNAIGQIKSQGGVVDQRVVDDLARRFRVASFTLAEKAQAEVTEEETSEPQNE